MQPSRTKRVAPLLAAGSAVLLAAIAHAGTACVGVTSRAIYRAYGYDHWVYLTNECGHPAACSVSTDVNATAIHVTVPPKERIEVLTFRGSPASTFTPRVRCEPSP